MIEVFHETNDVIYLKTDDPMSLFDIINKVEQKWGNVSFKDVEVNHDNEIYDGTWVDLIRINLKQSTEENKELIREVILDDDISVVDIRAMWKEMK